MGDRIDRMVMFSIIAALLMFGIGIDLSTLWWHHWDLRELSGDGFGVLTATNITVAVVITAFASFLLAAKRCGACHARMRGELCQHCGKKAE